LPDRLQRTVVLSSTEAAVAIEPLEDRKLMASTLRVYFMGNSMTDQVKYAAFDELATSRGHDHIYGRQTILGSAISTIWQNPSSGYTQAPYNQYGNALRNYTWDAITLNPTERDMYQAEGNGDIANALNLINLAIQKSPQVQPYVLQRTPRRGINADGTFANINYPARWNQPYSYGDNLATFAHDYFDELVGELRREQPTGSKPVKLIPVGDVMKEVDARIKRGEIPGLTDINKVYLDQSHYTNFGTYITGLTFFATLYGESPLGLGVPASYGGTNTIPAAMAAALQDAVWDVVTSTPYTGVTRSGYVNRAPFASADAKTVNPASSNTIAFDARGSTDVDGNALSYRWNFGDGTTGTGEINTHTYAAAGQYAAILTATDSKGASKTDAYTVIAGSAAPQLLLPNPYIGQKFKHGETITFAGSATDAEDGALSGSNLKWKIVHYANQTATTLLDNFAGAGGTFDASLLGNKDPDRFYRVTLTATDSDGVQRSIYNDVRPRVINFNIASNITGIKVTLDALPIVAGAFARVTANTPYTLNAPTTQVISGKTYKFVSWSDGGTASHAITAPTFDITYTAQYVLNGATPTPSTVTTKLAAAADATVRDGPYKDINYGSAANLLTKVSGGANSGFNREAYLRFSLAGLPTGARNSVKLRLYGKLDLAGQTNLNVGVYAVSSTSWSETGLKYSNKPAAGSKLGQVTVANTTSKWYELDLTNYVKAQLTAGKTAAAFALKSLAASGPIPTFVSGEGGTNAPQLVVVTTPTASRSAAASPAPTTPASLFAILPIADPWRDHDPADDVLDAVFS